MGVMIFMQPSQIMVFWYLAVAFRCHHTQDVNAADNDSNITSILHITTRRERDIQHCSQAGSALLVSYDSKLCKHGARFCEVFCMKLQVTEGPSTTKLQRMSSPDGDSDFMRRNSSSPVRVG